MNKIDAFNEDLGRFARSVIEIIEYSSDIQKERKELKDKLISLVEGKNIEFENVYEEDSDINFKVNLISKYETFIDKMTFIYIASKFEAFLNDIYLHLIEIYPNALKSKKSITHEKLLNYESLEDFVETLKKDLIEEYSFASFSDKMKIIDDKFNIDFKETKYNKLIVQFLTTRNILLHNDGKINETFNKFNPHLNLQIGTEIIIRKEETLNNSMGIIEFSAKLVNLIEEKINK